MLFTSPRLLPVRRCAIHDQEIVIELRHHAGVAQLRNGGGDGRGEARARMDRTTLLFHCATRPRCPSTAARPRRLFETVVLVMHNRFEPRHPRWMKMACRRRVGVAALACPLLMGSTCAAKSPVFNRISMSASDEFASGALPVATATHVRAGLPELGAVSSSQFLTARHCPDALSWICPGFPSRLSTSNCCKVLTRLHF